MFPIQVEDFYRQIIETASEGILIVDMEMRTQFANRRVAEMFGYTTEEMKDVSLLDCVFEEDREEILKARERRRQGVVEELDLRYRRRDGLELWAHVSTNPIYDGSGQMIGALGMFTDITKNKIAEEKLRESEERFAKAFNASPLALTITSLKTGKLVEVNETFVCTTGYSREEAIGRATDELGLWSHSADREDELSAVQEKRKIENLEYSFKMKDGREIVGLLSAELLEIQGEPCALTIIQDITERKKAEEISGRYRLLSLRVRDIILFFRADGQIVDANQTAVETYGYGQTDLHEMKIHNLRAPETLMFLDEQLKKACNGGVQFETIHQRKDGTKFPVEVTSVGTDISGEKLLISIIRDITERRKNEEMARAGEEQLRQMADSMPQVVWIADENGNVHYYNNRVAEFYGVQKSDQGIWNWQPIIHSDDVNATFEAWQKASENKESYAKEHRIQMADGNYRWHLSRAIPVFDDHGEIVKWYGTATDIHDLKQTETALIKAERRASDEYLELLSRIVPIAQTLGTARDLTSIYRAVHKFVKISMPCTAFFVSFFDAAQSLRTAEYAWGEESEIDVSILPPMRLTADGGPNSQAIFQKKSIITNHYWDDMQKRPHVVLYENGKDPNSSLVVPMIVMNRIIGTLEVQAYENDIFTKEHTVALEMVANLAAAAIENVRLLQVEADARETAEAANRAKDEFLSVLSHELRTPLNSMLGWVRMLRTGVLDKEKSVKAIEVIERNTLLQNILIEDLLDVSRIISGKMRIEKESVDLVNVFNNAVEILRPAAAQKSISLVSETKESSLIINGDATRFQQIIVNLAQNAVKFTNQGGAVTLSLKRDGDFAGLIVSDNGIGIGKEILPFIFERFQQADSSTKRAYSGLGLGLTIVKNLVELHGGTIEAESAGKNEGATFTVKIPLSREFLEKHSPASQAENISVDRRALSGARILLVDDDVEGLIPLQIFLEKENAEIVTATSAKEALEKLAAQNFHVLITDIGMPISDGYDLIARVRQLQTEQNAFITAIALTAYASTDDRRRALAAGFQKHFAKPVNYDKLLAVIKEIYESGK